ncbi:MAG: hypothetical protein IPL53_21875 [Ignavibacteria bacterium]|nr:hypothetical protein [Ignavibacteria bacterium]
MKTDFNLSRKIFELPEEGPELGTPEEHDLFENIQLSMVHQYDKIFLISMRQGRL